MNDKGQYFLVRWQNSPKIVLPELKGQWETALSQANHPSNIAQLIGYATLCERNFPHAEVYVRAHDITLQHALDGAVFITAPTLLNLIPKEQRPAFDALDSQYGVGVCELSFLTSHNKTRDQMELVAQLQYDTDSRNLSIDTRESQYYALAQLLFGAQYNRSSSVLQTPL